MIRHRKEKYSWEFIFLGANQDAFAEAAKIGIDRKDAYNFAATAVGVRDACENLNRAVGSYRKGKGS